MKSPISENYYSDNALILEFFQNGITHGTSRNFAVHKHKLICTKSGALMGLRENNLLFAHPGTSIGINADVSSERKKIMEKSGKLVKDICDQVGINVIRTPFCEKGRYPEFATLQLSLVIKGVSSLKSIKSEAKKMAFLDRYITTVTKTLNNAMVLHEEFGMNIQHIIKNVVLCDRENSQLNFIPALLAHDYPNKDKLKALIISEKFIH